MKILRRKRMMGKQKSSSKQGISLTTNGTAEGETGGVKKVRLLAAYIYEKTENNNEINFHNYRRERVDFYHHHHDAAGGFSLHNDYDSTCPTGRGVVGRMVGRVQRQFEES
jgi:hypothetical protein